ncbi:MAG: type VI secretion system contractile sheath large subunit [Bryobacteraceae bacterium]
MGDFSGRSWREGSSPSILPRRIDRDNFDEVLNGMKVTLDLHGITLSFREFEDFHPDRIYQSAAIFQNLDQFLDRGDPVTATSLAALREVPASGLLDEILAEHDAERPASVEDVDDLSAFIRRVTAGHLVSREDPAKQQRAARRQEFATKLLRGILHHPHMQAIEAAWRALFMLVRDLDTDGDLKLYILDITLPDLIHEMDAVQEELRKTGPWAVIAGNYTFGQSEGDAQVLRRLAGMASSLGAPFLGEARLSEGKEADHAWWELRRSNEARWLGLALPRFLLRLPYGKATGAIESFPFEEMAESDHSAYLWGNPAFFCAHLIGQSFLSHGWEPGRLLARRVDGLPMHVYQEGGEAVAKPCAEIFMTEQEAESLLESGFMPLVSIRDEPAAVLVRFQSIAQPLAPLAGLA